VATRTWAVVGAGALVGAAAGGEAVVGAVAAVGALVGAAGAGAPEPGAQPAASSVSAARALRARATCGPRVMVGTAPRTCPRRRRRYPSRRRSRACGR